MGFLCGNEAEWAAACYCDLWLRRLTRGRGADAGNEGEKREKREEVSVAHNSLVLLRHKHDLSQRAVEANSLQPNMQKHFSSSAALMTAECVCVFIWDVTMILLCEKFQVWKTLVPLAGKDRMHIKGNLKTSTFMYHPHRFTEHRVGFNPNVPC